MSSALTPLMQQYFRIKSEHPDAILFFRMGDFYEMFGPDAEEAAGILGIALTTRDKGKDDPLPMCGVPHHAAETYLAKLIEAGRNVAICEQVEDPRTAKGIVDRRVVRTVTPGTFMDDGAVGEKENRYILALCPRDSIVGVAVADLSTGEFVVAETTHAGDEIDRFDPGEIIVPETLDADGGLRQELANRIVTVRPAAHFDYAGASALLCKHFKTDDLSALGCGGMLLAVSAAGALLDYLRETQQADLGHVTSIRARSRSGFLQMDAATQRNLELVRNLHDGRRHGSLLGTVDRTLTPMGGRMFRNWILAPLSDPKEICERHDTVEALVSDPLLLTGLRDYLRPILDMERLLSRIMMERAGPRDLAALRASLGTLPEIRRVLRETNVSALERLAERIDPVDDVRERLERELVDEPPLGMGDGGIFREGVREELDELRTLASSGRDVLASLELRERERTGIPRLKIGYNRVFGYYLEVSNSFKDKVPEDYVRKQTLVNSERYITEELKDYENRILGADEKAKTLEKELFQELRAWVAAQGVRLLETARAVAETDVFSALAAVAEEHRFVRPVVDDGYEIIIRDGRHPVVEAMGGDERFTPNDTELDSDTRRLWIITGPNMAGKSTYMRQVALITILAQMGSFVPAAEARIGVADRVFTRIGASDRLSRGLSTFMVEMMETAHILSHATPRSLVLLDEIGRGTSTFDGVSIAWAVAEHLHDTVRARTLFATHYHELAEISLVRDGVRNANIAVKEWGDRVIFLRKIREGTADKSYGIQVARLAGLPPEVLDRARAILANLEEGELGETGTPKLARPRPGDRTPADDRAQLDLFSAPRPDPVIRAILTLDIDALTPLEALNLLHGYREELGKRTD